eukprot:10914041-Heterocapsa_arctica.AAC.1
MAAAKSSEEVRVTTGDDQQVNVQILAGPNEGAPRVASRDDGPFGRRRWEGGTQRGGDRAA